MRTLLLAAVVVIVGIATAFASVWAGEGWYVVAQSAFGNTLVSGPFGDDITCDKARTGQADYVCVLYEKRPEWDH